MKKLSQLFCFIQKLCANWFFCKRCSFFLKSLTLLKHWFFMLQVTSSTSYILFIITTSYSTMSSSESSRSHHSPDNAQVSTEDRTKSSAVSVHSSSATSHRRLIDKQVVRSISYHQRNDVNNKTIRERETYNVLRSYCLPCDKKYNITCRYGLRDCLYSKLKIDHQGKVDSQVKTLYTIEKKNKQNIKFIDSQPMTCFNKECKLQEDTSLPNFFHFCCYAYWIEENSKSSEHLYIQRSNVEEVCKVLDVDLSSHKEIFKRNSVILPYCKKRCFKAILSKIDSEKAAQSEEKKNLIYWDNDGKDGKRSSEKVIIDWLVTEENSKLYFGGKNKSGRTNANRKETYHNLLSDLIKKENGTVRTAKSIRSKISKIMEKYHSAIALIEQSGGGLDESGEESFMKYIHNKVCRYFDDLHEVLKDRPSTFPAFTNEMTEEDEAKAIERCKSGKVDSLEVEDSDSGGGVSAESVESDNDDGDSLYVDESNDEEILNDSVKQKRVSGGISITDVELINTDLEGKTIEIDISDDENDKEKKKKQLSSPTSASSRRTPL